MPQAAVIYPPVNQAEMVPANSLYWSKVRNVRAQLIKVLGMPAYDYMRPFSPLIPWVHLMAFVDPNFAPVNLSGSEKQASRVIHMTMELAAQCIASGTHRLATVHEIDRDDEERKIREEYCRKTEEENNPQKHATGALADVAKSFLQMAQAGAIPVRPEVADSEADGDKDPKKPVPVRGNRP